MIEELLDALPEQVQINDPAQDYMKRQQTYLPNSFSANTSSYNPQFSLVDRLKNHELKNDDLPELSYSGPETQPFDYIAALFTIDPDAKTPTGDVHPFVALSITLNDYQPIKSVTEIVPTASWKVTNPYKVNPVTNEKRDDYDLRFEEGVTTLETGHFQTYTTGSYIAPAEMYYKIPLDYAGDRVLKPRNDFTLDRQQAVVFVPVYGLLEQGLWGYTQIGQGRIHHEMHFPSDYQRVNTITHEANHTTDEYETRARTDARMNLQPDRYALRTLTYSRQEQYQRQSGETISISRQPSRYLGPNYHPTPADQQHTFVRNPWPATRGTLDDVVRRAA